MTQIFRFTVAAVLLLLLASQQPRLEAGEPFAMSVYPEFSFAPATLRITVRVDPNADNRAFELIADSGAFFRSSVVTLEGERGPKTSTFEFRGLPAGDYEIRGTLYDYNGRERGCLNRHANVQ